LHSFTHRTDGFFHFQCSKRILNLNLYNCHDTDSMMVMTGAH
jgi:hypothetical protein